MIELKDGTVLSGKYKIHEKVGEGGMSFVYRAEDMESGDIVAVKVLKKEFCYDDEFIKRFRNEAAAAQKLSHPNIVAIYDLKNDDDIQYIVMEYIEGITLDKFIRAAKKIPWKDTLRITDQILSAVEHAHANGVIHRDIKPLNIMITVDHNVKLTDFGIARAVTPDTIDAETRAGSVHYLSPEQIRGGYSDKRSDIYSIGITMYEMVTGSVPYDGDSHVSIALQHINGNIKPPRELDPTIPYGVSDLIMVATRKDADSRFQSVREMHERLASVRSNAYVSFISEYTKKEEPEAETESQTDENDDIEEISTNGAEIIKEDNISDDRSRMAARVVFQTVTYLAAVIVSVLVLIFVVSRNNIIKKNFKNYDIVQYKISDYRGMQASGVIESLADTGIQFEQELVINEEYPAGYVLSQSVEAGKLLQANDVIKFSVSAKDGSMILDDYTGQSFQVVGTQLKTQELRVVYKEMYSAKYGDGKIIRTSPAPGSIIEKNDEITIYYSVGSLYKKVYVPNVKGMTLEEAVNELTKANVNLNVGIVYPSPSAIIDDLIASPTPSQTVSPATEAPTPALPTETPTPEITPEQETPVESTSEYTGPTPNFDMGYDTPSPSEDEAAETETPTATETPTVEVQTPTPTVTPSPTPTPTHVYASDRVIAQYPEAGTEVTVNETVNLYFYDLDKIIPHKKLYMEFPEGSVAGNACYVRIEARTADSGKPMEISFMDPAVAKEKFPIEYEVPVSLNKAPTDIYIYIGEQGGTPFLYKVIKIYG